MAGLLDGAYSPDPLSMGLLGLGSALMTPRALGGGMGAGMNAFAQGAMQAQIMRRQLAQDEMQRKLFDLKLSEAAETAEDRKRKREMERSLQKAAQDAYRPAMPGVGDENNPYVPVADTPARFDRQQFVSNLYGAGMPGEAMRIEDSLKQDSPFGKLDPSKFTPESVRAFVASGGRDFGVLRQYEPPGKPATPTEIEKLIEARNRLPAGSPDRALIQQRIDAINYRQPPASLNVSYGAPFAGVDPTTGETRLYQPNNRGGPPQSTGLAPPPKEQQPAPERFNTAIAGINELRGALSNYERVVRDAGGPNMIARGANRANLQAAYTAFQMGLKNAMELGALAGPDVEILGRFVQDPTSVNASIVLGNKGVEAQIEQARRYLQSRERAITETYNRPNPANSPRLPTGRPAAPAAPTMPGSLLRFDAQGNLVQ